MGVPNLEIAPESLADLEGAQKSRAFFKAAGLNLLFYEAYWLHRGMRALIRRGHYNAGGSVTHGRLRFDTAARRLFHDDQPIELPARELALIELLLSRQGKVVSKEQMIDRLFGFGDDVSSNAIEVYVHRVRKKLEPLGVDIRTVRGMGYLLDKLDERA